MGQKVRAVHVFCGKRTEEHQMKLGRGMLNAKKVITASVMCIEALLSQDAGMLEVYVVSKAAG